VRCGAVAGLGVAVALVEPPPAGFSLGTAILTVLVAAAAAIAPAVVAAGGDPVSVLRTP
jgi:hypothetical protein